MLPENDRVRAEGDEGCRAVRSEGDEDVPLVTSCAKGRDDSPRHVDRPARAVQEEVEFLDVSQVPKVLVQLADRVPANLTRRWRAVARHVGYDPATAQLLELFDEFLATFARHWTLLPGSLSREPAVVPARGRCVGAIRSVAPGW